MPTDFFAQPGSALGVEAYSVAARFDEVGDVEVTLMFRGHAPIAIECFAHNASQYLVARWLAKYFPEADAHRVASQLLAAAQRERPFAKDS